MPSEPAVSHPFAVEDHRPLSRSKLWELQRQLYVEQGIRAWREGGVPHYITTNSFAARAFARVVVAHLRGVLSASPSARSNGVRILELGAGAGRFALHFLEHFFSMWLDSELASVPVTYVMTDVAPKIVDFWRSHPALAPFVQRGQLAFATCDAESRADLQRALETGAAARRNGPLVVLANYLFDELKPDLYLWEDGRMFDGLVALRAARPQLDPAAPLSTLALEIARRPLDHPPFEDAAWNRLLNGYRLSGAAGGVLFPTGAIRCLDALRALSPESLLVLAADEGSHRLEDVTSGELRLLTNESAALPGFPVNFHALGAYAGGHGGQSLFAGHEPGGLCVAALAWEGAGRDCAGTRQAFRDAMDLFGPEDFFRVMKSLERIGAELTSAEMLAHLRWSAYDVKVLQVLLPHLRQRLPSASPSETAAWVEAFDRVWSLYYHLDGDEGDFAFGIGAALTHVGNWAGASTFFERSRGTWGDDGNTLYNIAVCQARLGDRSAAIAAVDGVLASNPGHGRAVQLRRELVRAAP